MKKLSILLLTVVSTVAWGHCEREDVTFYLSKGFTPEQITRLCTKELKVLTESASDTNLSNRSSMSPEQREQLLNQLRASLNIDSIFWDQEALAVTKSIRVKYGERDVLKRFPEVQAQIRYRLEPSSIRVIKLKKRVPFLSPAQVHVSADMKYEIVAADTLKPEQVDAIEAFLYEEGGEKVLVLPVNKQASLERVGEDIRLLGR